MFTFEYFLAVTLLTAPPGTMEVPTCPKLHKALSPYMQALAVEWEILDPREVRYVLARPEDFQADVRLLCYRYHELASAPPLRDYQRFPDRPLVNDLMAFNRSYRQDLLARRSMDLIHADELQAALQETDQLYRIWDAVRDARCEYYYVTVRRQALHQLREMIGAEAFYSGRLPPHVPTWRFREID